MNVDALASSKSSKCRSCVASPHSSATNLLREAPTRRSTSSKYQSTSNNSSICKDHSLQTHTCVRLNQLEPSPMLYLHRGTLHSSIQCQEIIISGRLLTRLVLFISGINHLNISIKIHRRSPTRMGRSTSLNSHRTTQDLSQLQISKSLILRAPSPSMSA